MNFEGIPIWREYDYVPPPELKRTDTLKLKTLIVGGGPIGLALALDLAKKNHDILVLNALPFITRGSKAICFSKRSLDIWDRLGVGERLIEKGVVWEKGKVFWKDEGEPVYEFDLLPVKDQKNPGFINLQQYYAEEYFLDELEKFPNVEIRWKNEVVAVDPGAESVLVTVQTPDGSYNIETEYLLACDGCKSPVRDFMGLDFEGRVFEDNFLIADVKFKQDRPVERWFRFDPPYPGSSSLIHKQPDGVWRLDFQLGWDIDKKEAVKPENVEPFVRGFLGPDIEFEYEWVSVYTFQCRRMERFVHGRVIFAGDSAHLVSPFGARGCNGGYADVDNLAWKLDLVLNKHAPESLLESYNDEAVITARENIMNSSRSTDFMTPKTQTSQVFRNAVLELSRNYAFARPFVNSGRLSTPVCYPDSVLSALDSDRFEKGPVPGSPCIDMPLGTSEGESWLLSRLGSRFVVLLFTDDDAWVSEFADSLDNIDILQVASKGASSDRRLIDSLSLAQERYGALGNTVYLVRPDQYVAGRWLDPEPAVVMASYGRAIGR